MFERSERSERSEFCGGPATEQRRGAGPQARPRATARARGMPDAASPAPNDRDYADNRRQISSVSGDWLSV